MIDDLEARTTVDPGGGARAQRLHHIRRRAIERRQPTAGRHPTRTRDPAAFGGRGIADSDARPSASPAASSGDVGGSEQPTAGPTDPCSPLTQAEASHLIGVALGPGKRQVADPDTICTWAKGTTEVKVFLTAPTTPAAAKAYYEAHKSEIPDGAHITELPTFFDGSLIAKACPADRDHRRDLRHRWIELLRAVLRHARVQ